MTHDPTTDLCRRNSVSKTLTVDIACACFTDTREAASYLARHHIPIEVARRVLLTPHLRRRTA